MQIVSGIKKRIVQIPWKAAVLYGCFLFFAWLMLLITLQYIPMRNDAAFLQTKQEEIVHGYYRIAFFAHVYSSMFALIAALTQFSATILRRQTALHRYMGKLYVAIVLFVSAPSGLIMGYFANGGITARISFCLLAILWLFFTYKGYTTIRIGAVAAHRRWMYRSYALTLSAISLRLWKWLIVLAFEPRPMDTYRIVAWLGWVLNLLIAEWIIRRKMA